MKITKNQLRRIILESIDSEPFDITSNTPGVGESIGYDYTVTERRPSLFQGIGGQPMERVAFTYRISPEDDTVVYSDFPAVPKGMPLKDFFEAGLNRGFPDMYPPIPPNNAATGTAKGMPRVGEPIKEGRMKITKNQLRRIIREAMQEVSMYDQGREDSFAGIRPQFPDEDYMMGYNEAQADAGLPTMQAPSDSGRGKKLDPRKLKGATMAAKYYGSR